MFTIEDTDNGKYIVRYVDELGSRTYSFDTVKEVADFVLNYFGHES